MLSVQFRFIPNCSPVDIIQAKGMLEKIIKGEML